MKLLVATRNGHKTGEIGAMLGSAWSVEDLTGRPELPEPEETGATFEENARIKALAASVAFPELLVLADDSGLEVDALGGAPGIYSARYAGKQSSDEDNRQHLLAELSRRRLEGADLSARFRCAMALARGGEILRTFEGRVEGRLILKPAGAGGFGYDPLFIPEGYDRTLGELDAAIKNQISHRSKALALAVQWLNR